MVEEVVIEEPADIPPHETGGLGRPKDSLAVSNWKGSRDQVCQQGGAQGPGRFRDCKMHRHLWFKLQS
jgi:hypothetical protein